MWLILGLVALTVFGGSLFPDKEKNTPKDISNVEFYPDKDKP